MDEYNNNNNNSENEIPTENKEVTENNNGQQKEEKPTDQYYQSYRSYQSYSTNQQQNTYSNENQNQNQNQNPNGYYYSQQTQNTQYTYDPMTNPVPQKKKDTFGIASFCLSLAFILLMLCCCCCAPFAGVFLFAIVASEVLAIIFAVISKKKMGKFTGLAIAGLIIAIVVLVIIISMITVIVVEYSANPEYYNDLGRALTEPGYYKEFFAKHEPEIYEERREEIDDYFEDWFEANGISADFD